MRARARLMLVVLLALGAVMTQAPAEAGLGFGVAAAIDIGGGKESPAGRVAIWLSREPGGAPDWNLRGEGNTFDVPLGFPGGEWVVCSTDLDAPAWRNFKVTEQSIVDRRTAQIAEWAKPRKRDRGPYPVETLTWPPPADAYGWWPVAEWDRGTSTFVVVPNLFTKKLEPGQNACILLVPVKENRYFRITLILSATFKTGTAWSERAETFVVNAEDIRSAETSDWYASFERAKESFPHCDKLWEQYADQFVSDQHYPQLRPAGTDLAPVRSAQNLWAYMEMQERQAAAAAKAKQTDAATTCLREIHIIGFPAGKFWLRGPAGVVSFDVESKEVVKSQLELPMGSYYWYFRPAAGDDAGWTELEAVTEAATILFHAPQGAR